MADVELTENVKRLLTFLRIQFLEEIQRNDRLPFNALKASPRLMTDEDDNTVLVTISVAFKSEADKESFKKWAELFWKYPWGLIV